MAGDRRLEGGIPPSRIDDLGRPGRLDSGVGDVVMPNLPSQVAGRRTAIDVVDCLAAPALGLGAKQMAVAGVRALRDVLQQVLRWQEQGIAVALARVVQVSGSGPRAAGAAMAVAADGRVAGSVSGGCIESAVVEEALAALADGRPRTVSFGFSDDEPFAVGLTCGGTVRLLVVPSVGDAVVALAGVLEQAGSAALATVVSTVGAESATAAVGETMLVRADGEATGEITGTTLAAVVRRDTRAALDAGWSALRHYGYQGEAARDEVEVLIECYRPPPRMIIFGAMDFAASLARLASMLGYRATVCDARATFATAERFPMAAEVVVEWPHRYLDTVGAMLGPRDAVCILTHDPKFDVPATMAALRSGAGYIGVLGSRRTHAERAERLKQAGAREDDLARLMSPIGLDIGARSPEETAVSICAEIIALRSGREVPSLRDGCGPIHRGAETAALGVRR